MAVIQARLVADALRRRHPHLRVELEVIRTHGDEAVKAQGFPGKALFTQRIEEALADGLIDAAVHSLKDLPEESLQGLVIAAVPERERPEDALVSLQHDSIQGLPHGAVIATSSARRSAQLLHVRPDLRLQPLSGNVGTRVRKLRRAGWDGIVLAAAGLRRLGLQQEIKEILSPGVMLPAPGQGALAVQTVRGTECHRIAQGLQHTETRVAVDAERAFSHRLGGDCNVPVAALASVSGDSLVLQGCVAKPDGSRLLRATLAGPSSSPEPLGAALADRMLMLGAGALLEAS